MIVCLCKGLTDRVIRTLIRGGANSTNEVGRACHAGRGCGGCRTTISRLVMTEKRQSEATRGMMKGYER